MWTTFSMPELLPASSSSSGETSSGLVAVAAITAIVLSPLVLPWAQGALADHRHRHKGTRRIHRLPTTLPVLNDLVALMAHEHDIHDWLAAECERLHGEPLRLRAPGRSDWVVLSDDRAFEEVFKNKFDDFPKGEWQHERLRDILGDGIFSVDGLRWLHQRKTASNLFTMRALRETMTATIRKHTTTLQRLLQRASENGEAVDLFRVLNRFTLQSFAEIGFGIEMDSLETAEEHPFQRAFDRSQRTAVLRFVRPGWLWRLQRWLGIGAEGELQRDLAVINSTLIEIVTQSLDRHKQQHAQPQASTPSQSQAQSRPWKASDPTKARDLVSIFLEHAQHGDAPQELTPTFLRDLAVNFLIAGRDTTAQALSWFFKAISENPEIARRIRQELEEVLPGLSGSEDFATPTLEDVQHLTYLEAALRETLRLYPSVPLNTKYTARDVTLADGTFLPEGTVVAVPSYTLGRMTHVWGPDAAEFKPERWLDPATGRLVQQPAHKFIAFNAGPRLCLGMNLAMLEMKIVAASLLSKFELAVVPGQNITYEFSLTLPVKGELRIQPRRL